MSSKYDELDTTAQRVYKYLSENIKNTPKFISYATIAQEVDRTRSSVAYAMGVLIRTRKVAIQDRKIYVL